MRIFFSVFVLFVSFVFFSRSLAPQTLKVDVELVNIFATVKDNAGNPVPNLRLENFRVYEDGELQDIRVFESENNVESSIGLLMDTSGSMVDILPFMKKGVREFARSLRKRDEFFVVSFGTNVKLLHNSSESQKHLDQSLTSLKAYGTSALFDALLYSIEKVERSQRPRKALIVFTDGNDNGSNVSQGRIVQEVQSSAVLLYFVAIGSPILVDSHTLEPLSGISGGRTLYVGKRDDAIPPALEQIRAELSEQYYLGYYATRKPGFHRIRVEVPGRDLKIRAKSGYTSS